MVAILSRLPGPKRLIIDQPFTNDDAGCIAKAPDPCNRYNAIVFVIGRSAAETTLGEVRKQRADSKRPRLADIAGPHPVDQTPELGACNRDNIAGLVGETLADRVAVFDRREHRAQEKNKAVGILMIGIDRLTDKIFGIAADHADGR